MAEVLNRKGQAKKIPETDAIFTNLRDKS